MLLVEKLEKPFEEMKTRELIFFICDYCGIESKKTKYSYITSHKTIKKDCCGFKKCKTAKAKEVNLKKYGFEYTTQVPEFKKKSRQTCLDKYGVEYSFQSPETKEKIKQTNLERYGVENPNQHPETLEKIKKTNLDKYGVEYSFQSPETKEKIKQTNLERYGVESPLQVPEFKEKVKQTCLDKYGYENPLSSPEIQEKVKQTCVEKFGHQYASSSQEFKEKVKQTCLDKYGVEYILQSPEIQTKAKQTCLDKYGHEHASSSQEIQEKIRQTCLEKFGVENPLSSPEIQEKIKRTNLEKYGVENTLSSPEVQEKIRQTNIERYGSPYPIHKYGKTQAEITEWLNSFGFNFQSDYTVLEGKELDLYDEKLKFAIEYCGLHWHHENSPQPRDKNYHESKYKKCKDQDIQLITIFEDEWLNKEEIIKSVILSKLGIFDKRIYARKCIAKEISKKEFTDFCNQYHVQGGNNLAKVCFGLFHENELIGVMDLGNHHRKQVKDEMVLTRMCFKAGYQINGGASKLFSYCVDWCKKNGIKKIISWSDNRWSNGSIYKNLKFQLEQELSADYAYVNVGNPKERISKQSQMKNKTNCPKGKTEKEWALENGLSRIYDCGKVRWKFDV